MFEKLIVEKEKRKKKERFEKLIVEKEKGKKK